MAKRAPARKTVATKKTAGSPMQKATDPDLQSNDKTLDAAASSALSASERFALNAVNQDTYGQHAAKVCQ